MTRELKCLYLIEKGYTYNPETGEVKNPRGKILKAKDTQGYLIITINKNKKNYKLFQHHYAYFMTYGNIDFQMLDHINGVTDDNRISNLRSVTNQQNHFNRTKAKGYTWDKSKNKWKSQICINNKRINIGLYKTEQEARQSYLIAKEKYHII